MCNNNDTKSYKIDNGYYWKGECRNTLDTITYIDKNDFKEKLVITNTYMKEGNWKLYNSNDKLIKEICFKNNISLTNNKEDSILIPNFKVDTLFLITKW